MCATNAVLVHILLLSRFKLLFTRLVEATFTSPVSAGLTGMVNKGVACEPLLSPFQGNASQQHHFLCQFLLHFELSRVPQTHGAHLWPREGVRGH